MRTVSTIALGLALALGTATGPVLAQKTAKPAPVVLSPPVRAAAVATQAALAKNDLPTAITQAQAAAAAATTPDDRFVSGQLLVSIGQKNQDNAILSKGIGMMLDSGKAPADQIAVLNVARAKLAYNEKNYPLAESAATAARAAGTTDPDIVPVLASSMNLNNKTAEAIAILNEESAKRKAAGQPVPLEWYQQGVSMGYTSKNPATAAQVAAGTTQLTQGWVAGYPTKSNWHDALRIYSDQNKVDPETQLELLRLGRATGSLLGAGEYLEYAEAVYLRYPNEAATALQEGSTKGVINLTTNKNASEILTIVKGKVAADKASLPASEKTALAAPNGRTALNTADAYATYGDYAKAIELYKLALTKGGVDAGTANLHMGAAQASSGDTAGAKQTFAAVTGPKKPVADFWLIHLDHPTVG